MKLSWHNTDQVWLVLRLYELLPFAKIFRTFEYFIYSCRSYAFLKSVGAGREHILLQQYIQNACWYSCQYVKGQGQVSLQHIVQLITEERFTPELGRFIVLGVQIIPINIQVRASRSNVKVKDQVYSQMLGKGD